MGQLSLQHAPLAQAARRQAGGALAASAGGVGASTAQGARPLSREHASSAGAAPAQRHSSAQGSAPARPARLAGPERPRQRRLDGRAAPQHAVALRGARALRGGGRPPRPPPCQHRRPAAQRLDAAAHRHHPRPHQHGRPAARRGRQSQRAPPASASAPPSHRRRLFLSSRSFFFSHGARLTRCGRSPIPRATIL